MAPNVQLLQRTMRRVELASLSGEWQQGSYRSECGTAFCFAGWSAIVAGVKFASDDPMSDEYDCIASDIGPVIHVAAWARNALGLTFFQAGELFNANKDLEDLRYMVDFFCEISAAAA